MTVSNVKPEDILYRRFNDKDPESDAIKQAWLYNEVTKNLPGPNSHNATKESILGRLKMQFFDPNGIIYAFKTTGQLIAYCQSIQITNSIIRIGYPWSLPHVSNEVKESLLNQLIRYYKQKLSGKILEFEIYTIDFRWKKEIQWLEKRGFNFLCYWLWPTFNLTDITLTSQNDEFEVRNAQKEDFKTFKGLFNQNDDMERFRKVNESIQEKKFQLLLQSTDYHIFLAFNEEIFGFIAVSLPNNTDSPVDIFSLLVKKTSKEKLYTEKLLSLAFNFGSDKGYSIGTSWFKEDSIFHQCLNKYIQNETKWYHGSLIK